MSENILFVTCWILFASHYMHSLAERGICTVPYGMHHSIMLSCMRVPYRVFSKRVLRPDFMYHAPYIFNYQIYGQLSSPSYLIFIEFGLSAPVVWARKFGCMRRSLCVVPFSLKVPTNLARQTTCSSLALTP